MEELEITTKAYKHCTVLKANGRVDSETAVALKNAFDHLLEHDQVNIVFDMSDLEYMSSAGFRVLLASQKTAKEKGGEVVLALVPELIADSLELTGFKPLFTLYDNLTDAVGHF